jgi:hypothetical protein
MCVCVAVVEIYIYLNGKMCLACWGDGVSTSSSFGSFFPLRKEFRISKIYSEISPTFRRKVILGRLKNKNVNQKKKKTGRTEFE